jgi:hypothetical protein
MEDNTYFVRWTNHTREVFGELGNLRDRDHLSDVVVHCGGRNFNAHKVVLAASSTFFARLLAGLPRDRSQVLVMSDMPVYILEKMLDFFYGGEVYLSSGSLEAFMAAAERLGVRGLGAHGFRAPANPRPGHGPVVSCAYPLAGIYNVETHRLCNKFREFVRFICNASSRDQRRE